MSFPEVIFADLDESPTEVLQRIAGIAAELGWEQSDASNSASFFEVPENISGAANVDLHVWFPPNAQKLVCEVRHGGRLEANQYRKAVTEAVRIIHQKYLETYRHNLDPFIEMFPQQ